MSEEIDEVEIEWKEEREESNEAKVSIMKRDKKNAYHKISTRNHNHNT